jgi:hypothetical protein
MRPKKWRDGTVKSMNNAFNWQGQPSIFTAKGQRATIAYVVQVALRVNQDGALGAHGRIDKRKRTRRIVK